MKRFGALALLACACSPVVNLGDDGRASGTGGSAGGAPLPSDCGLDAPAFCEGFDVPHPGGRGGDLDENRIAFSRWGHDVQYFWVRHPARTDTAQKFPATFCGKAFEGILPGEDVRVCEGEGVDGTVSARLEEVFDDQGDFGLDSMLLRQPFDFAGRTGKIVWDVDGKVNPLNIGHGWWTSVWITEDAAQMPNPDGDGVSLVPRRAVGFLFRSGADCRESEEEWFNALETVVVYDGSEVVKQIDYSNATDQGPRCFRAADAKLNHFELRLSEGRAEFWASDAGDAESFRLRDVAEDLNLPFSRGYVHFQHGSIFATADGGVTSAQSFRWDNLGFDGPRLPAPRGYSIPDNDEPLSDGITVGYTFNEPVRTFRFDGVDVAGATRATLSFLFVLREGAEFEVRWNGGAFRRHVVPKAGTNPDFTARSFALQVPLEELVPGDNAVSFRIENPVFPQGIANINLTVDVGR